MVAACSGAGASADAAASLEDARAADWVVALPAGAPVAGGLSPHLLGHYDLSGALFDYRDNTALRTAMAGIGLPEWRVGLGRWEFDTRLLPTLADGHATSCAAQLAQLPANVRAPDNATDDTLIADRDWFSDTGQPVTAADTADDTRYRLDYIRSVLDTAAAFGASPFVGIDHMPRALGVSRTFVRGGAPVQGVTDPCLATWTNHVSNARPADTGVFAAAVVGAVRRIVEGTPGAAPRSAPYWEVWNEPDLGYAWDQSFEQPLGSLNAYFATAITTLTQLAAYRAASTVPAARALKLGLGSFASVTAAVSTLTSLDTHPLPDGSFVPLDFLSFHAYSNDPLDIVAAIQQVATARAASQHYRNIELALAEWGPDLSNPPPATTMDPALLVAAVVARGAALGLDHAHHSLFYAFVPGLPYAVVANDGTPLPLYHAYALLHSLIADGADRLQLDSASPGAFGSLGDVLAARTHDGTTRVLVVNRDTQPHHVRVDLAGTARTPARVEVLADPASAIQPVAPTTVVDVPARSIALVTL